MILYKKFVNFHHFIWHGNFSKCLFSLQFCCYFVQFFSFFLLWCVILFLWEKWQLDELIYQLWSSSFKTIVVTQCLLKLIPFDGGCSFRYLNFHLSFSHLSRKEIICLENDFPLTFSSVEWWMVTQGLRNCLLEVDLSCIENI